MESTGDLLTDLVAAVLRQAVIDARQTAKNVLAEEAAAWLWENAPSIAQRAGIPLANPERRRVMMAENLYRTALSLPEFCSISIPAEGRASITETQKVNAGGLEEALRHVQGAREIVVKRFPGGSFSVEATRLLPDLP